MSDSTPRYPNIVVQLSGQDGNAFFIIARASMALRRAGVPREEITMFQEEAMSSDYDNVIQTVMEWVSTE